MQSGSTRLRTRTALDSPVTRREAQCSHGDLVRVETEIGYYVVPAWVTEGIRPGIVACSHHMGRWKLTDEGQRQLMATVKLDQRGTEWSLKRQKGIEPYKSDDPDTLRIWWKDAGVHQNMTFPVHPDPISGCTAGIRPCVCARLSRRSTR
jgi:anaerobic selenocysteine-containing dehydrogenase